VGDRKREGRRAPFWCFSLPGMLCAWLVVLKQPVLSGQCLIRFQVTSEGSENRPLESVLVEIYTLVEA
jgi:hypothetical protein